MIFGIGTDLVAVPRIAAAHARHGERLAARLLSGAELEYYAAAPDPVAYLAKRFAAKEAFAKALGTGVRAPATLHNIRVVRGALGKPAFAYAPELARHMAAHGLVAHLSLSDERDAALAFVIIEQTEST